jgi:hypothetical protein
MTDFENAALVTFIVLLTRAIMTYNLNLLIPISNVRTKKTKSEEFIDMYRLMKICNLHNNVMHFVIKNFIFENLFLQVWNPLEESIYNYFYLEQTPDTPSMTSVQKNIFQQNGHENGSEHRLMTINEIINGSVSLFSHQKLYYHHFLRKNLLVF